MCGRGLSGIVFQCVNRLRVVSVRRSSKLHFDRILTCFISFFVFVVICYCVWHDDV